MACAPRNRWISRSHYFKLDVYNFGISKIHLKTHEKKTTFQSVIGVINWNSNLK
jgi:hypothetical protein